MPGGLFQPSQYKTFIRLSSKSGLDEGLERVFNYCPDFKIFLYVLRTETRSQEVFPR